MTNTTSVQGSSATDETMAALKRAQESLLSENIKITSASASNPGIPPSSLMTFSKKVLDDMLPRPPKEKNHKTKTTKHTQVAREHINELCCRKTCGFLKMNVLKNSYFVELSSEILLEEKGMMN